MTTKTNFFLLVAIITFGIQHVTPMSEQSAAESNSSIETILKQAQADWKMAKWYRYEQNSKDYLNQAKEKAEAAMKLAKPNHPDDLWGKAFDLLRKINTALNSVDWNNPYTDI